MPLFAVFGPIVITLLLIVVGAVPYALWVTWRKPSGPARWALIGIAATLAAYGAGTVYGLAFTNPLDICGTRPATACTWMPAGTTA